MHGKVHRGVGEGRADVSRSAHLYHHVIAGPCGANSSVGDSDTAHGCGTRSERWTFDLRAPNPREVGLLSDPVAASLGPIFDGCPLLATGILNVYDLQDLYGDFTERLPAGDIFNKGYGKLILLGSRHFAGKAPSRWNIRGDTQISWTVSMTRIAHSVFPFNPAPLR